MSKAKKTASDKSEAKVTQGAKAKDWSAVTSEAAAEAAPIPDVKVAPKASTSPGEEAATEAAMVRLQEQLAEYKDIVLRSKAEVENMRLRTQKEVERAHAFGLERFVKALLPVADSLEQAIAALPEGDSDDGLKITYDLLIKVLSDFAVRKVGAEGEPFDANVHEAMSLQEADGAPPNTIINVVRTGYSLNGRAVRPAMVIVAK